MSVKFVDKNRKNDILGDEIIARCDCGCGMISFSVIEDLNFSGDNSKNILRIQHYSNQTRKEKHVAASDLYYPGKEGVEIIIGLIKKTIGNEGGVIEDLNGSFLMVNYNQTKDDESLLFAGFYDEKSLNKYMKNPQKNLKYLSWNVMLGKKETNKLLELIEKVILKEFNNEICDEDNQCCSE